eukprot:354775-Chlamydomonas_euryale.AAC.5
MPAGSKVCRQLRTAAMPRLECTAWLLVLGIRPSQVVGFKEQPGMTADVRSLSDELRRRMGQLLCYACDCGRRAAAMLCL